LLLDHGSVDLANEQSIFLYPQIDVIVQVVFQLQEQRCIIICIVLYQRSFLSSDGRPCFLLLRRVWTQQTTWLCASGTSALSPTVFSIRAAERPD
jgi:hypothetical protein